MVHFHVEFLVEDSSGKIALESIASQLLPNNATYKVHSYRGIGRLPVGLRPGADASKRILLNQLPRIIAGYGRAFEKDSDEYRRFIVLVCDADDRNVKLFESELNAVIAAANPMPLVIIGISVEEGEAWLLGDVQAVTEGYPKVNQNDLAKYIPDSICGTWEFMADLIEKGGCKALRKAGYREIGAAKHRWAAAIAPRVVLDRNRSPSLAVMRERVRLATS